MLAMREEFMVTNFCTQLFHLLHYEVWHSPATFALLNTDNLQFNKHMGKLVLCVCLQALLLKNEPQNLELSGKSTYYMLITRIIT
jgi:hypothetical protein